MVSLFECLPTRQRPFVIVLTIACAVWSLARTFGAEDVKAQPPLPRPASSPDEERVFRSLPKPTTVEFLDLALHDGLTYLKEYHNIGIRVDTEALANAKIALDSPVTLKRTASFQRIINILVEPLGLDWYIEGADIVVTTRVAVAAAVKARLEKLLEPELQIVDHLCRLTESQRQKLRIAARGDIRRLTDAIAEYSNKVPLSRVDEQMTNEVCLELEQLQRQIQSGPFAKGSLFRKALETTLSAGQSAKYDPVRAVLEAGGLVGTLESGDEVILGVHLFGAAFSDDDLARLKAFTPLGFLRLDGTEITDKGLASLKDLTNLQALYLAGTRITDAGLAHLSELKNLQVLSLGGATAITNAGLAHLKGLTKVQVLDLAGTQVTGAGLAHLRGLTNMQELNLYKTQLADEGTEHLAKMAELRRLYLTGTQVTGAGLANVKGLVNLQELTLSDTPVADDGVPQLERLADLRMLGVSRTRISDAGLVKLKGLINLRRLHLEGTRITDAGIADLKRALPELEVTK